jgi:glycosyltransferase involved in cell wall biosynthesis
MTETPLSVITPDVSENCLGRALLLADLSAGQTPAQVVGIRTRDRIWPAAASWKIPVRELAVRHSGQYLRAARWLRAQVAGTRVIVSKPRATSLGLALLAGIRPDQILLDVDDWEVGFRRPGAASLGRLWRDARDLVDPTALNSYWAEVALDRLVPRLPHRLVSNRWLQQRFGGTVLPHVRDTDLLDPARVHGAPLRRELEMEGRIWVGFIGTARAHKGVEDLVAALARLREPGLFLAGVDQTDPYVRELVARAELELGEARVRVVGQFGFEELPSWVSLPEIVCVPSRAEPGAVGQIPAKLFDAMAMGKPVIASRVNDIAHVLDGAGIVVEPGDDLALSRAIAELADAPLQRAELGRLARARAVDCYSYRAGREILREALKVVRPS